MSDDGIPFGSEPPGTPRTHVAREAAFQKVVVAFINKVVMPPMWVTAIAHENELSDNARARARARGVMPGVHDLYVCQAPKRSAWLELKWGANKPSDAQHKVSNALWECGIDRGFCWSMDQVLRELRTAGFNIHGNADNLCVEYQARAEALVARAEVNAGKRVSGRPPPKAKPSRKALRFAAARVGL